MNVWLDDEYEERKYMFDGWVWARWPADVIEHLKTGTVEHLSLDYFLGEDSSYTNPRTGYDVVAWLEEEVKSGRWNHPLPRFRIHSKSPEGKAKMAATMRNILKMYEEQHA